MIDGFRLGTIYRRVYGHVRDRIERLGIHEDPDDLVVDPLEAAGTRDTVLLNDPQVLDVIRQAIDDARAGAGRGGDDGAVANELLDRALLRWKLEREG